jgi:hypothetical protein
MKESFALGVNEDTYSIVLTFLSDKTPMNELPSIIKEIGKNIDLP